MTQPVRGTHGCSCGAAGDAGEMAEHLSSRLDDDSDPRDHQLMRGTPVPIFDQAATARARRQQTRQRIADQLGVSVAELREALR